jgi:hypothetical protein
MHAARPVLEIRTFHWQLLQQMFDPIRNYYNAFIPTYTTTEQRAVALFIFRWLSDDIFNSTNSAGTVHSTLYTVPNTLYTAHSTQHTVHSTLYRVRSTQYTVHSTQYTVQSTQYTVHSTLYTLHSTLYTEHCT